MVFGAMADVALISGVLCIASQILQHKFAHKDEMKEHQDKIKKHQTKMNELSKKDDAKSKSELDSVQNEMMQEMNKMMSKSMFGMSFTIRHSAFR